MKKDDGKKIAVLIPCYNESKTIEKVVKDYKKAENLLLNLLKDKVCITNQ